MDWEREYKQAKNKSTRVAGLFFFMMKKCQIFIKKRFGTL